MQAEAVAPDGSLYVLANVTENADGSTPAGGQDVALQKYDSAGNLIFSHDLGSASSASGLSLAVSADGSQVAVAGQVTGVADHGQTRSTTRPVPTASSRSTTARASRAGSARTMA
ncbi:MAG: hypothetical protein WDM85_14705 [Caulobacteraceae bacterium]